MGEYAQAIVDYTEAIRLRPQFAQAYENRAFSYSRLGEHTRAENDRAEAQRLSGR